MSLKMETRVTEGVTVVSCTGRIVFGDEATALRENLKKLLGGTKKNGWALSGRGSGILVAGPPLK